MPNCANCSAPLPVNAVKCDYCGSRNDVDLTGVHYYTAHENDTERICPVCNIPMKTIDLGIEGKFFIERCEECLGLFFDPGELEALLDYSVKNVFEINRSRLAAFTLSEQAERRSATYVKCPVCAKIMNRINFGTHSGVVIDRCKEHGVWLDAGELRQLAEWMKSGGKLLDREREEERRKDTLITAEQNRQSRVRGGTTAEYDDLDPFNLRMRSEPDLLDVVFSAVKFFISK
ncbi:MAG: zf-TFIIB domain-containing protein [Geobacteraceae bacterium]|nr:zf-TFIIB domain-containing protein [Geobacteraceae bacterium]